MIVRSKPSVGYTTVPNGTLRDTDLSFRARGVLAYILSMPANWETNSTILSTRGLEGRDAIRSALQELRNAGYIVTTRHQDSAGRWSTTHTVYDSPDAVNNPVDETGDNCQPKTENQASVFQALREKELLEKENKRAMGQTELEPNLCTNCDGTGWIHDGWSDDIAGIMGYDDVHRCQRCKGDGIGTKQ